MLLMAYAWLSFWSEDTAQRENFPWSLQRQRQFWKGTLCVMTEEMAYCIMKLDTAADLWLQGVTRLGSTVPCKGRPTLYVF